MLLAHVPGDDQDGAPEDRLIEMVRRLVALQARWVGRIDDLLAAGLWDARAISLPARVGALLARPEVRANLDVAELATLDALHADLPARLDGPHCVRPARDARPRRLPPGELALRVRRPGAAGLGRCAGRPPALRLRGNVPGPCSRGQPCRVREAWLEAWRAEYPAADTERAAELIAPIAALLGALVYQGFLDGIEPSERPYHEADVPACLRKAVSAMRSWHGPSGGVGPHLS